MSKRRIATGIAIFDHEPSADISFKIGEKTAFGHKDFLATKSEVFKAMFFGPMAEKGNTIEIVDFTFEGFNSFLKSVYYGEVDLTSIQNLPYVLYGCQKYLLDNLAKDAELEIWKHFRTMLETNHPHMNHLFPIMLEIFKKNNMRSGLLLEFALRHAESLEWHKNEVTRWQLCKNFFDNHGLDLEALILQCNDMEMGEIILKRKLASHELQTLHAAQSLEYQQWDDHLSKNSLKSWQTTDTPYTYPVYITSKHKCVLQKNGKKIMEYNYNTIVTVFPGYSLQVLYSSEPYQISHTIIYSSRGRIESSKFCHDEMY